MSERESALHSSPKPQYYKGASATEQHSRIRKHVAAPNLGDEPADRRANKNPHPDRGPHFRTIPRSAELRSEEAATDGGEDAGKTLPLACTDEIKETVSFCSFFV
jgi:hypothetical protein